MNCIFGFFGPGGASSFAEALPGAAQRLFGQPVHTVGLSGGTMGSAGGAPCTGPRRCVWKGLDCSIVLSGHLTNQAELTRLVVRRGFPLADGDDGELALALYMLFGQECVHMLHGQFAFVIFDSSQGIAFLARDRFGLCPLYYALQNGSLLFSSSSRLMLCLPGMTPAVSRQGLWQLLLAPGANYGIWRDFRLFPAGHTAILRHGALTFRRSWFLRPRRCFDSQPQAMEHLELLRRQALEAYSESADLLQMPRAAGPVDPALFARAVQAAELPEQASPGLLALLQARAGHSEPFLADVGVQGLDTPESGASFAGELLNGSNLHLSEGLAWLQRRRHLPASGDAAAQARLRRRLILQEKLLPAAACWSAMGQAAGAPVCFPFLDHRLVEYEYELPFFASGSSRYTGSADAEIRAYPPLHYIVNAAPAGAAEQPPALPEELLQELCAESAPLAPYINRIALQKAIEHEALRGAVQRLALLNRWAAVHRVCFEA